MEQKPTLKEYLLKKAMEIKGTTSLHTFFKEAVKNKTINDTFITNVIHSNRRMITKKTFEMVAEILGISYNEFLGSIDWSRSGKDGKELQIIDGGDGYGVSGPANLKKWREKTKKTDETLVNYAIYQNFQAAKVIVGKGFESAKEYLKRIIEKYGNKIDLDDPIVEKKIFIIIKQNLIVEELQRLASESPDKYVKSLDTAVKTLQSAEEDLIWLPKQKGLDSGMDSWSEMGKKYLSVKMDSRKVKREEAELLERKRKEEGGDIDEV